MDKILVIHGGKTVARIECDAAYTHDLFYCARNQYTDYAVAFDYRGAILWVSDAMSEQVWEPESTNPEDTRKETLDRFAELAGKW